MPRNYRTVPVGYRKTQIHARRVYEPAEYMNPFTTPLVKAAFIPAHCTCTWSYFPTLGGRQTPWVLKFIHRGGCFADHAKPRREYGR